MKNNIQIIEKQLKFVKLWMNRTIKQNINVLKNNNQNTFLRTKFILS